MAKYDRILVPTDGSKGAEAAVEHAVEIGEKFNSEIHVIHVIDVRNITAYDMAANIVGEFKEIGEKATKNIIENIGSLETKTEVIEGIPSREINEYVEENDVDLVVMGTLGKTGLDRVLIGSTAEKVVRTCKSPVLTVRKTK